MFGIAYHMEISTIEFKKFFAILLYTLSVHIKALTDLWAEDDDLSRNTFVQKLLSRDRFKVIYRAFRFSDDQLQQMEEEMQEHLQALWIPATAVVVDETIVATKSTKNPHHVFILRKPHPHGIKVWLLVDLSGFVIMYSVFRRNAPKEATHETLLKMTNFLLPGTVVTADSYFGSVKAMEELTMKGKYCLFSCNRSRPSVLFKDYLMKEVNQDQESKTCYGTIPGMNAESVPFLANAFQSHNRKLYTLSTVFSAQTESLEVQALVKDDSEDKDQSTYNVEIEERPEVRVQYGKLMDFVDTVDQITAAALSPNRKREWSQSLKTWEITMLLIVNARKLYISATGILNISPKKWKRQVRLVLAGLPSDHHADHPSAQEKSGKKLNCRSCYYSQHIRRQTRRICTFCGPICCHCDKLCEVDCKKCEKTKGKTAHQFYKYGPSTRHYYGNPPPKKQKLDEVNVSLPDDDNDVGINSQEARDKSEEKKD